MSNFKPFLWQSNFTDPRDMCCSADLFMAELASREFDKFVQGKIIIYMVRYLNFQDESILTKLHHLVH